MTGKKEEKPIRIFNSSWTDEYFEDCKKKIKESTKRAVFYVGIASVVFTFLWISVVFILYLFEVLPNFAAFLITAIISAVWLPASIIGMAAITAYLMYAVRLPYVKERPSYYQHKLFKDHYLCVYDAQIFKMERKIEYSNIWQIHPFTPEKTWVQYYSPSLLMLIPSFSFYNDYAGFYHPMGHGPRLYRMYLREPVMFEDISKKNKFKYVVVDIDDIEGFKKLIKKGGGLAG